MPKQKEIIQAIVDERVSQISFPESNGLSAYELAVQEGYIGTLEEWLLSLHGQDGTDGNDGITPVKNVDYFDGVKGDKGDRGDQGLQGIPGENGSDADVTEHESSFTHSNIHAPGSDNQDLSAFESHVATQHLQFSGLAKITVGTVQPTNPTIGDLWINSNT
jgi:hypothetical protein